MDMHANGFHMNPVRAHLYTAWELEFQRRFYFRLKQPQVYLYKPEHWSYQHIYLMDGGRLFKRYRSGLLSLGAPPNAH